ncbi:UAA transporter [Epithele typhae]|uniref:UAA transporter n=1 Tax=Epithele typhae TaxID=378194 RepID=UPI0020088EE9|nr:UAA transporter [Epithele typhae]KAH9921510.1 UAA transporter [Epithele typhae]
MSLLAHLALSAAVDWTTTLSLIFGGCCSNALTLEQLTRAHPRAGALITFAQFAFTALVMLPTMVALRPLPFARKIKLPWLRRRRVPLAPYLVQVALFSTVSRLNNAAFAYAIPMPVHIIFRSGGLGVSMLMGWAIGGKRYTAAEVFSVLLVSAGVVLTTLSASSPKPRANAAASAPILAPAGQYATGIALLALALVLGGALGLTQDWINATYVRPPPAAAAAAATREKEDNSAHANGHASGAATNGDAPAHAKPRAKEDGPAAWQESLFYLHFLSLPTFYFARHDLATQARALAASAPLAIPLAIPAALSAHLPAAFASASDFTLYPPFGLSKPVPLAVALSVPSGWVALALTTVTAVVCSAGVNRLTARVSSLTVTLVLVVRKALSMVLSVAFFNGAGAGAVHAPTMWAGAALVFLGTMGYAASRRAKAAKTKKD